MFLEEFATGDGKGMGWKLAGETVKRRVAKVGEIRVFAYWGE